MVNIISFEPYRKVFSQIKVELSSGDVYVIGFPSLQPVQNKDLYTEVLMGIINDFEDGEEPDLNNYLSYRLACQKLETPLYVTLDSNGDRERIGRRIREIRTSQRMDAKTLAQRSLIDAANLSRIEQGRYSVGLDVLSKIALALNARVDIIPNEYSSNKESSFSFTRKVWVIPTGEINGFDPICTVPACGFSMWPNKYEENFTIGDLIVFYLTDRKEYCDPFIIAGTDVRMKDIGEAAGFAENWPTSEYDCYLKVKYLPDMSSADIIHIREAIGHLKNEPTGVVEVKL